ncbi:hypothetical protein, partial [Salmonella sp. SAL4438]|uniref:hypothetical protein n=1 Tax=Salmonella sp. SAL4438 TaxID=3159893 RepID=UPI00397AEEAA
GIGLVWDIKMIPSMRAYAAIFRLSEASEAFDSDLVLPFLETLKSESTTLRFPAAIYQVFLSIFGGCGEMNRALDFSIFIMSKSEMSL